MRMGEMLSEIPKATKGSGSNQYERKSAEKSTDAHFSKTKAETIADIGISRDTAKQYQQMAAHPEIVEQAIADMQAGCISHFTLHDISELSQLDSVIRLYFTMGFDCSCG